MLQTIIANPSIKKILTGANTLWVQIKSYTNVIMRKYREYRHTRPIIAGLIFIILIVHWSDKDLTIISIIVAYIGYLNWEAGQNKFRLELFEKRWEIYEQLIKALSIVMQEGSIGFNDTMKLLAGLQRHKIKFFFGTDIQDYISEIYKKCIAIQSANNKLSSDLPVGEERTQAAKKWESLANDLGNQLTVAQVKFKPYLYFGNL